MTDGENGALFTIMEKEGIVEFYMTGGCGIFAIALHKVFGYAIGSLLDDENTEYYDEDEEPIASVVHVFAHDGDKIIDAKGVRSIEKVKADYWDVEGRIDWEVSEREIREEYSGEDRPLYPVLDSEIQEAVEFIENNREEYSLSAKIIEKPLLENIDMAGIGKQIKALKLNGFGGDCPAAAIEINDRLFDGEGEYIVAANKFWFNKHHRVIGHVAVKFLDRYWDASGETTLDHLESWGMLDEQDPDYSDDPEWTPEDAYEVELLGMNEDELREIFDMEPKQSLKECIKALVQEEFERTHITGKLFKKFNDIPIERQQIGEKPKGLWYDLDRSWIRFVGKRMPGWWSKNGKHTYKVQVDLSKMIVIRNYKELVAFEKKYGTGSIAENDFWIDWPKVARDYSGIEIATFIRKADDRNWYYVWDVASGCIWEKSALKNVEKV